MPQVRTVTPDGERIRALRLDLGLTAEQLAEKMPGRHAQTIRRLERGAITNASEDLIAQVARALKVRRQDITRREQHERAA